MRSGFAGRWNALWGHVKWLWVAPDDEEPDEDERWGGKGWRYWNARPLTPFWSWRSGHRLELLLLGLLIVVLIVVVVHMATGPSATNVFDHCPHGIGDPTPGCT